MTVRRTVLGFILTVAVVCGLLSPAPQLTAEASGKTNQKIIFKYLTKTMKLPPAAACGVLANIEKESSFNPEATGDGGTSYGICQWHKSRFSELKSYCRKYDLDYKSVNGQLDFLRYELKSSYPKVLAYLKHVSNDPFGAYQAGYYWCYHFERPARYLTSSVTRGELAKNRYWPRFGKNTVVYEDEEEDRVTPPAVSAVSVPKVITEGERLNVEGTITSVSELRKVQAGLVRIDETESAVTSVDPSGKKCNLRDISGMIGTDKLGPGVYLFQLTAANAAGTELLVSQSVTILARTGDLLPGNYTIAPTMNKNLMIAPSVSGNGTLELTEDIASEGTHFQFVKFTNGYYSVRSLSENKYLTLESDGRVHLSAWTASDGQLWQFINGSGKLHCLIPKSHTDRCLSVIDLLRERSGITVSETVQNELQFFRLFEADDDSPLQKPEIKNDNTLYLEVPKTAFRIVYGDADQYDLKAESNGEITYTCSVPDVVEIDANGVVRPVGYGKTVVVVRAKRAGFKDRKVKVVFKVFPRKAVLTSAVSLKKKTAQIRWQQDLLSSGYDLQISTAKKFTAETTVTHTTKNRKKDSTTLKKLKRRTKYYVRIRAYKIVNGKKAPGAWSARAKVVVK